MRLFINNSLFYFYLLIFQSVCAIVMLVKYYVNRKTKTQICNI